MLGPRTKEILSKDCIFMSMAIIMSGRSKDPNTQVGSCLVSSDNRIIGTGYNGFPRGIGHDKLPWDKKADKLDDEKYLYVAHAEENAIANCDKLRLKGSKLYTTLYPCNKCAITIIQHQISEIIYLSDKYHDKPETRAARRMFALVDIYVRQFEPDIKQITIDFKTGKWTCK
jgi:dCMP deaminase